jgi:peptidyl-prolyl cis-trans isomerase A (cyclophilin A)
MRFSVLLSAIFLLSCSAENKSEFNSPKKATSIPVNTAEEAKQRYLNNETAQGFLKDYFRKNTERSFEITTKFGDIGIRLYNNTPIHTGNFVYLVKEHNYYDSTLFYRVAPEFIIQGGNRDEDTYSIRRFTIGEYSLPAEFRKENIHKRGALAMSRNYGSGNPDKNSTSFDFYIVVGKKHSLLQLRSIERDNELTFNKEAITTYEKLGGAPHLDFQHTVFGEVSYGMEVVDEISKQETDSREWPLKNVAMSVKIK